MVTSSQVKEHVAWALGLLWIRDDFLLTCGVHERSVTHKLAGYLQQEFPGYNADCEYNRYEQAAKTLLRECKGETHSRVFPDIVVHMRGSNDSNLLIVEAKPDPHFDSSGCDSVKLQEFTKPGMYHYQHGLFIGFNGLDRPTLVWFKDGQGEPPGL